MVENSVQLVVNNFQLVKDNFQLVEKTFNWSETSSYNLTLSNFITWKTMSILLLVVMETIYDLLDRLLITDFFLPEIHPYGNLSIISYKKHY